MTELTITTTDIPGLLVLELPLHGDARGWFKENWQREKMVALGLPDFGPVQNNMSYNDAPGVTRGLHAEPWDKLVSVACGTVYGAWVDLREGPSFGTRFSVELTPGRAVFVPYGVANGYQALEPGTTYSYLVNDHWSPAARDRYTYVNLADPALGIAWPLGLEFATISDADRNHPLLADVIPMQPRRPVIIGAGGQLATALQAVLPDAVALGIDDLDITDAEAVAAYDWSGASAIINAAAYTAVDAAETDEGRRAAWAVNVTGVGNLAAVARRRHLPFVHVSSDYVFDGTAETHDETEAFSPLGVYGQTKAAGDALAATVPVHYVLRTSWLIGDGNNFVRTMARLAANGVSPSVVDDQIGRLSFTSELAAAIAHLLATDAAPGTYNATCAGAPASWCAIARRVFELSGRDAADVSATTTEAYGEGKQLAPRPLNSVLELGKLEATGFTPRDWDAALVEYLQAQ